MSCPRSKFDGSQNGAALVVAMLVFALVAALMVGLQRDFSLSLQRGTNQLLSEQAWAYLIGAEGLAALALQADSREDARAKEASDNLNELWAQPPTPYPLDAGGWLNGAIEDLQGRLNLNLLPEANAALQSNPGGAESTDSEGAAKDLANSADVSANAPMLSSDDMKRWTAPQKVLIRLLQSLDEASLSLEEAMALTDAITDFIDRDAERRVSGAEEAEYRYADYPYLPANRALASVSELRAVQGMTEPIYVALAPLVTVWPEAGGRLNVLTSPLAVLRALNGDDQMLPLPKMEAERLDMLRREGAITSVSDLLADPVFEGQQLAQLEPLLDIRSDWFLLDATVELVERKRHLFSVLHRMPERTVAVFRSEGEL
jgi:general secretion pathway protein K